MDIPRPHQEIVALAAFVRERLSEVSDTIVPLLNRREGDQILPARSGDPRKVGAARQLATVIVSAAAPLAPNAYSRARLIRQMHASGLLSADEARRAEVVLRSAGPDDGGDVDATGAPL